ncbi:MAG: hypothetical protein ABII80_01220 [bacterium]
MPAESLQEVVSPTLLFAGGVLGGSVLVELVEYWQAGLKGVPIEAQQYLEVASGLIVIGLLTTLIGMPLGLRRKE